MDRAVYNQRRTYTNKSTASRGKNIQTKPLLRVSKHFIKKVISQKVKLGQQLETWQIDMQKVLEEQIELKLANKLL